jgi:very-short-patch-repair endonuclease
MDPASKARQLRKNSTEAESTLWKHLRNRQLEGHKFRRQVPLGQYVVDFVCFEHRLIIEIDGGHHQTQTAYDNERTKWLESQGFRVLRFWNNEILGQIDGVSQAILKALQ